MADKSPQRAVKIVDPTTNTAGASIQTPDPSLIDYGLVARGDLKVRLATDYLMEQANNLTPIFQVIAGNAATISLKSAVTGRIRVLQMYLRFNDAVNFYLRDTTPTNLMGTASNPLKYTADNHFILFFSPLGWIQTAVNKGLQLVRTSTTTITFSGSFTYVEI